MIHGRLAWTEAQSGQTTPIEIPMLPAVMLKTGAAYFLKVVKMRLPLDLRSLKLMTKMLSICLGTDAAKSCKRMGGFFKGKTVLSNNLDGVLGTQGLCLMHAVQAVVNALMA